MIPAGELAGKGSEQVWGSSALPAAEVGLWFHCLPCCKLSKMPQHDYLVSKSVYQRRKEGQVAGEVLAAAQVSSAHSWGRMCSWVLTLWHDQDPAAFHSSLLAALHELYTQFTLSLTASQHPLGRGHHAIACQLCQR